MSILKETNRKLDMIHTGRYLNVGFPAFPVTHISKTVSRILFIKSSAKPSLIALEVLSSSCLVWRYARVQVPGMNGPNTTGISGAESPLPRHPWCSVHSYPGSVPSLPGVMLCLSIDNHHSFIKAVFDLIRNMRSSTDLT